MSPFEIILLALALSIDASVVSFSYGITFNQNRLKTALLLAIFTGFFQGLMPCIGYFLTTFVKSYIAPYASAIVFTIFVFLGLKFIKEAFDKNKNFLFLQHRIRRCTEHPYLSGMHRNAGIPSGLK